MQLLRERDVPAATNDRVFRYSRARAILTCILWSGGCVGLLLLGVYQHEPVLAFSALLVAAGLFLARGFFVARFRSSNWLVRANQNGLYVKFRSFLNSHFSSEDLIVAFIPYREIVLARAIHESRELPELSRSGRATSTQKLSIAELELACDTTPLATALDEERTRPAPRERTWYGTTGVKYQHDPVTLANGSRLCITWECAPRAEVFLRGLARFVAIAERSSRSTSFMDLVGSSRAEQERRIAELARSGQLVTAIAIARRLYAYDLKQARDFVESVRKAS